MEGHSFWQVQSCKYLCDYSHYTFFFHSLCNYRSIFFKGIGIMFCCCASCSFLWFFHCFQRFWLILEGCHFDLEIVWILHFDVGLIKSDKRIFWDDFPCIYFNSLVQVSQLFLKISKVEVFRVGAQNYIIIMNALLV